MEAPDLDPVRGCRVGVVQVKPGEVARRLLGLRGTVVEVFASLGAFCSRVVTIRCPTLFPSILSRKRSLFVGFQMR